ncbi:MAG: 3-hydroxyacyl-CoA dehydrogenase family protein [Myxococcales bacterium]|nr:3-hydroxyacyl-CoA dehydrogenase family protein [Myxococcales bacterium]
MKIAILGMGVMGRGWITQFAMYGHTVHCHDVDKKTRETTVDYCARLSEKSARRLKIDDPEIAAKTRQNIVVHDDRSQFVDAAKGCDIFFEIIVEDLNLKCRVLGEIVPQLPERVVFWSNTSSLDIDVLARAAGRPQRSIVSHGMNPVPMMKGVEIVPGRETSPETVDMTRKLLLDMDKVPFAAPNIPGFWVNRLLIPQMLDAIRLLEIDQVSVKDGDDGLFTCLGHPQGTFKLCDFISTPTMLRVSLEMFESSNDPRLYPPRMLARMVKNGEYGAATGKGFYDWSDPKNPVARSMDEYKIATVEQLLETTK